MTHLIRFRVATVLLGAALVLLLLGAPIPHDSDSRSSAPYATLLSGFFADSPGCTANDSLRRAQVLEVAAIALVTAAGLARRRYGHWIALALIALVGFVAASNGAGAIAGNFGASPVSGFVDLVIAGLAGAALVFVTANRAS